MWIVKGLFLGTGFFVAGTFLFLILSGGPIETNHAIGLSAVTGITVYNPLFWLALVACLALGVAVIGSWPVRVP